MGIYNLLIINIKDLKYVISIKRLLIYLVSISLSRLNYTDNVS